MLLLNLECIHTVRCAVFRCICHDLWNAPTFQNIFFFLLLINLNFRLKLQTLFACRVKLRNTRMILCIHCRLIEIPLNLNRNPYVNRRCLQSNVLHRYTSSTNSRCYRVPVRFDILNFAVLYSCTI